MTFRKKIEQRNFVRCIETVPPKGKDIENILNDLKPLKGRVDATTVVDSPLGIARMHPLAIAYKAQELGIEAVMHFTCRDRNKIEIEAGLLAASALGIKNILALTGDATKNAKPVFELNSFGLIDFVQKLNEKHGTDFFVGAGLNVNADDLENELERARKKIEAGARFFITQPCFDAEKIREVSLEVPVIAGVLIISDRKTAEFFAKVPGIKIPENLFELVGNREKVLEYYKKLISGLEKTANGICLMPIGNYEIANKLI